MPAPAEGAPPEGVAVTILADRGFGDVKLFEFLESLRFRYVIRFRGDIHVFAADRETRLAADWAGKGGRARMLRDAEVTATRQKVGAVVCVKAVGMKEAWHLATSDGSLSVARSGKIGLVRLRTKLAITLSSRLLILGVTARGRRGVTAPSKTNRIVRRDGRRARQLQTRVSFHWMIVRRVQGMLHKWIYFRLHLNCPEIGVFPRLKMRSSCFRARATCA